MIKVFRENGVATIVRAKDIYRITVKPFGIVTDNVESTVVFYPGLGDTVFHTHPQNESFDSVINEWCRILGDKSDE
jgi:hypothetical protein